ncbi:DUF2634 domain-containing protein [Paenibacillus larvae]
MLPTGYRIQTENDERTVQPSLTYDVNLKEKRITGRVDGLEAIRQAVHKILHTERYEHLIYSPDYGSELTGLIGQAPLYVQSELKRRISEALLQDDRIEEVGEFRFSASEDRVLISFTVTSLFGKWDEHKEVKQDVRTSDL